MSRRIEYHTTATGDVIPIAELSDRHLDNIIKMIERKAEEGIDIVCGGGHGDYHEMWADVYEIEGDEVLDHYDYEKYIRERKRRNKP